ncbi:MAG TPA: prepilin-type N-terminal cleavage/methylation domain-containing protein [Pyrinomonadaceae bacterium]|jgi:prepilin-type N-terminal cleavage/methylation domain-containing protein
MEIKYLLSSERGFSLIEMLVVIVVMAILVSFALLGTSSRKLYAADTQALAIIDILQEARQKALTQGKTLRVEINDTDKQIRLIDENATTAASDDEVLQTQNFDSSVTVGVKPANVNVFGRLPKSNSPIPEIQFKQTTYPPSANDRVKTLRFMKNGEVVDGGTDDLGTDAMNSGVTIYVYNGASGSRSPVVRAVTVSGITAAAELLKCQTDTDGTCIVWVK